MVLPSQISEEHSVCLDETHLTNCSIASDENFALIQHELTEMKSHIQKSEAMLRAQELKLQELTTQEHKLNVLANERYLHIVALQRAQDQLNIQKHSSNLELNETYRQLDAMHRMLIDIHASTSWRVTKPFRFISRQLKRIRTVLFK